MNNSFLEEEKKFEQAVSQVNSLSTIANDEMSLSENIEEFSQRRIFCPWVFLMLQVQKKRG